MKIIVGLGNPGKEYQNSRHNIGFKVVDGLWQQLTPHGDGGFVSHPQFHSLLATVNLTGEQLLLVKPQTHMNNSGMAVAAVVENWAKWISPEEDLWVCHDELDLPLGTIRIRQGGGSAGHHGIESIMAALDSGDFVRVRLGIFPGHRLSKADEFVLSPFLSAERHKARQMINKVLLSMEVMVTDGVKAAMNQYNR